MKITEHNDLSIFTDRMTPNKYHDTSIYKLVKEFLGEEGLSRHHNIINNWMNRIDPSTLETSFDKEQIANQDQKIFEVETYGKFVYVSKNDTPLPFNGYEIDQYNKRILISDSIDINEGDVMTFTIVSQEFTKYINHYLPIISEILELDIQLNYSNPYNLIKTVHEIVEHKGLKKVYVYLIKLVLARTIDNDYHIYVDENDDLGYVERELEILENVITEGLWIVGDTNQTPSEETLAIAEKLGYTGTIETGIIIGGVANGGNKLQHEIGYYVSDSSVRKTNKSNISPFSYTARGTFRKDLFKKYMVPINHPMGWDINYELYSKLEMDDTLISEDDVNFSIGESYYDQFNEVQDEEGFEVSRINNISLNVDEYFQETSLLVGGVDLNISNEPIYSKTWLVGDEYIFVGDTSLEQKSNSFSIQTT